MDALTRSSEFRAPTYRQNPRQCFFAEKSNKKETFWRILAVCRRREFARMSESVHHADSHKISSESGEMAPEYHELLVKVFKMTTAAMLKARVQLFRPRSQLRTVLNIRLRIEFVNSNGSKL